MIHDVRTPVEHLAAAEIGDGLPVVAALIAVARQTDLKDVAQFAAVHQVLGEQEVRLEAAVVADEQAAAAVVALAQALQLERLLVGHAHRLLAQNVLASEQRHLDVLVVIAGAGGDGHQLDVGIADQILDLVVGVNLGEALLHLLKTLGNDVARGDDHALVLLALEFLQMHAPARAAKADQTDSDRICHDFCPPSGFCLYEW